jgi:two-component system response regulator FixJ
MADKATGTVAIVDDDPAVLDSLKFLLEVMGCTVAIFTSAREYLDAGEVRPACMILDQHMPQMTGLELAQKLRANGVSIPVLLITGSPSPAIVARANELGIEGVLEKPPDENDLLNFVKAHA